MQHPDVRVCMGTEVHELLARDDFVARWQQLFERCPWATAGQRPDFTRTWYRVYQQRAFPVLVYELRGSELVGVLPLHQRDGWLEQAGRGYCEYNVWTALPEHGETFMPRAIDALDLALAKRRLAPASLVFGFMPPETPIRWLSGESSAAARCQLGHTTRRVLRVSDPELVRSYLKSKSRLRTSMNKLKRTGDVRFRRVVDPDEVKRTLLEFEWMIEFRKGAVFGSLPFRDEPLRRECLLAQAEVPGLLHVTTLERGGRILAAHVATCGRRELSIAGIVHSEFEARHSPGSLLMLELVPLLCQEGIQVLDFTPGDDEYKTRFATETEPVYTLTLHGRRLARERERARELIKTAARRLPEPVLETVKALRDRRFWAARPSASAAHEHIELREITPLSEPPLDSAVRATNDSSELPSRVEGPEGLSAPAHLFQAGAAAAVAPAVVPAAQAAVWSHNTIEHLMRFQGDREEYVELLRRAYEYVRAGASVYTRLSGERLEAACFVLPSAALEPSLGLSRGVVFCELERWGTAAATERWTRELAQLLSAERPLFVARRATSAAPSAVARVRGRTALELLPSRRSPPSSRPAAKADANAASAARLSDSEASPASSGDKAPATAARSA